MSKTGEQMERLRDLPDTELNDSLGRAQDELFRLRLAQATDQVEDRLSIRAKRREVARIQTLMRARTLGVETQATASAAASDAGGKG